MAETCAFPNCNRIAQKDGLCIGHHIYKDSFPSAIIKEDMQKKEKQQKRIKPVSDKRKVLNRDLAKLVKNLKIIQPECTIKSPVCTGVTVTANHIQKRSPKNIADPDNLEACCAECNGYVENFPTWAKENGHHKIR